MIKVEMIDKREGKDAVSIRKEGFVNNNSTRSTGKSTYVRYFEKGSYQLIADLEQIPGDASYNCW